MRWSGKAHRTRKKFFFPLIEGEIPLFCFVHSIFFLFGQSVGIHWMDSTGLPLILGSPRVMSRLFLLCFPEERTLGLFLTSDQEYKYF